MTITVIPHSGAIVISDIINDTLVTQTYYGYTSGEAMKLFEEEFYS